MEWLPLPSLPLPGTFALPPLDTRSPGSAFPGATIQSRSDLYRGLPMYHTMGLINGPLIRHFQEAIGASRGYDDIDI